jgi:four helix bundle protein
MQTHRTLEAWKEARQVAGFIIRAAREHWRPWASALFGQVLRSSLSVQLNIAEGATFGRSATYARHLGIAYGSAVETGELVEHLVEAGVLPPALGRELTRRSSRSQRLLLGLLKRHRPIA